MSSNKKSWVKSAFSQMTVESRSEDDVNIYRKKRRVNENLEPDSGAPPNESSNNKCESKKEEKPNAASAPTNWIDVFSPQTVDELAVHAKKVAEFQEWLQHCEEQHSSKPAQICILSGPTGSGKTTAVQVIAKSRRYNVQEWVNPLDTENITTLGEQSGSYIGSQVEAFKSFLLRASRYKSLFDKSEKRILLVEDFPNAIINDSETFASILGDFTLYGKSPLVFVVADSKTKQLNLSHNLFPEEIKSKLNIKHITFNPIASTLMIKAMKRFRTLMGQGRLTDVYKMPEPSVIESIAFSSHGDIRNAMINLHFASLKGAPGLQTKSLKVPTKGQKQKSQYALKTIGRDESVTMLHVLGRVFNPKYTDEQKFVHSPESLVDMVSTEPKKIVNFIHANYLEHFNDIESVISAVEGLSLADIILKEYREESLSFVGLNVGIRSVMVANTAPVSGWKPVRGPKRITVEKPWREQLKRYGLRQNISTNLYISEYGPFLKYIPIER